MITCQSRLAVTYDPNWLTLWTERFGNPLLDAETFRLTSGGVLSEIGNKPKTIEEVQGQYMGLLFFSPEGWGEISRIRNLLTSKERDHMHMTATLQKVIDGGYIAVSAIAYNSAWGEVDNVTDLATYEKQQGLTHDSCK